MIGRIAILLVVLSAFAACGKEGDPQLKPGQSDAFPRTYPPGAPGAPPNIFRERGPGRGVD